MVYVRLTKDEQAALAALASANRRRIADEAGLAVARYLQQNGVLANPRSTPRPDAAPRAERRAKAVTHGVA